MGFALFDQSGTFNPLDYDLSVGDVLEVMCVGGGGGGACFQPATASGGNGGPSSFGSYLTALGGYGASAGGYWLGTPTQYMTKGSGASGYSNSSTPGLYCYGGAGGGGWWYDVPRKSAQPTNFLINLGNSSQYASYKAPVDLEQDPSTAGRNGIYCSISGNYSAYTAFEFRWPEKSLWQPIILDYSSTVCQGVYVPTIPVAAGCAWYNYYKYNASGEAYPTNRNAREFYMPTGGLGYGAGGGTVVTGMSTSHVGGCGGELRRTRVVLQSVAPIAVGVGGGGAGGVGYYTGDNTPINGAHGTAGAAGAAGKYSSWQPTGCPGGYGTMIPAAAPNNWTTSYYLYTGGGGAGGCVAIWW